LWRSRSAGRTRTRTSISIKLFLPSFSCSTTFNGSSPSSSVIVLLFTS
jgi:hypothetical protein